MRADRFGLTRIVAACLGAALLTSGCADTSWHAKDISHLMPPLAFDLLDEHGRRVNAADYRGSASLLFFGYTHCPDICPATLARLSSIVDALDDVEREKVRILFVSVDPARDDVNALNRYTDAFGPNIVGLTGEEPALDALTKRYRVTYGYGKKDAAGNYPVSHPGAVFVFDRSGAARLLIREADADADVAADLRRLLREQ